MITTVDRIKAQQQADEIELVSQRASNAMARALTKVQTRISEQLQVGEWPISFIENTMMEHEEELVMSVLVAYFLGKKRALMNSSVSFSRNTKLLDMLTRYFGMTEAEIDRVTLPLKSNVREILLKAGKYADQKMQRAITESIISNETPKQAIKRLAKAAKSAGIHPTSSHSLEAVFRTNTNMTYSAGKWKANEENRYIREMLWGYKYVTVGDNRVRESHAELDGVVLPKDDPRWNIIMPPNGWNCRCQVIEVWKETEIVPPPAGVEPDEGFRFNPGKLIGLIYD